MRLWNEARVAVYSSLRRHLPPSVRDWIGGSRFTEPLRRLVLWPTSGRNLVETPVSFCGHSFLFSAPIKESAQVRRAGGIENGLCRLILEQCKPGSVALDVGANYGFVTLVMARAVGPTGQVHSFEADAAVARALERNVRANELTASCSVNHAFVADTSDGHTRVSVDDYVRRAGLSRVDFLKIDVDGPDYEVLAGARATLSRFHPVVAIEMTGDQPRILALLEELGYSCTDMSGRDVDRSAWPPNVLAAVGRRLQVPGRAVASR